ncbi:MAG: DUF447 domain-containing protein [Dehalobacterium sp.]
MIIETIISSQNQDGAVNFAPMGVHISHQVLNLSEVREIGLCLYSGSQTFINLHTTLEGVVNFTDDVLIFVETALFSPDYPTCPSRFVQPPRLASAQKIWEFTVTNFDASQEPAKVHGQIKHDEELAGWGGFCRAQWAVLEAAIAATRWQRIPFRKIKNAWILWQEIVEKTGGTREREALNRVREFFNQKGLEIDHK